MAEDLLARIGAEIDTRLRELHPALLEYERLLAASGALAVEDGTSPPPAAALKRTSKAPPASSASEGARRRRSGPRGSAAGAIVRAGSGTAARSQSAGGPPQGAARAAAQQAILAALEHGSHTVSELTVVTAMNGQKIRENLRRMLRSGAVTRAKREGKAAYASPTAHEASRPQGSRRATSAAAAGPRNGVSAM